jgi:NACalpha-BTF3-like transcription factor
LSAHPAGPLAASEIQKVRTIMGDNIENYPRLKTLSREFNEVCMDTTLREEVRLAKQSAIANQFLSEYVMSCETRSLAVESMAALQRMVMQRQDTIAKSKKEVEISEEQVKLIRKQAVVEALEGIKKHLLKHEGNLFDYLLQTASSRDLEERRKAQEAQQEQLGPPPIDDAEFTESKT